MRSSIYIAVGVVLVSIFLAYPSTTFHAQADPTPTPVTRTLTINGVIPPRSSDFQFNFVSDAVSEEVGKSEVVTFTVTYGSSLDYATSLTLEAEWTLGTSPSSNVSSFDVLSYVPGSASDAYGGTDPVINTVARTITWSITSFPANTQNQQVTFQLVSPSSRVSDETLGVDITATLSTHQIQLPTQEIHLEHAPIAVNPTATRTPTPAPTSVSSTTSTPTPTPTTSFVFTELDIQRLNSTSAVIRVKTNRKSKKTLTYATSTYLDMRVPDNVFREQSFLEIQNLTPDSKYYLKVIAEDESGVRIESSDFFTFTTPSTIIELAIRTEDLTVSSSGIVLVDKSKEQTHTPVTIPKNVPITIVLPSDYTQSPLLVYVRFVNSRVLGVSSTDSVPYLQKIRLLETQQGIFSGIIKTPSTLGEYDLLIETHMSAGSPLIETLAPVRVVNPMTVLSAKDDTPIEDARVYVETFNNATRLFEPYSSQTFGFPNPIYSDANGMVPMLFADATYIIKTSRIGYKTDERKDIFISKINTSYPVIRLLESSPSIADYVEYYSDLISDLLRGSRQYMGNLLASDRVYDLTSTIGIAIFSILSLTLAAHKIKIGLEDLYVFIELSLSKLFRRGRQRGEMYSLFVVGLNGLPVPSAFVMCTEIGNPHRVFRRSLTNAIGEVHVPIEKDTSLAIHISKRGYQSKTIEITQQEVKGIAHEVELVPDKRPSLPSPVMFLFTLLGRIMHSCADVALVVVVVSHLLYIAQFGVVRDIPFALITFLNILLYAEYVWKSSKR